MAEKIKLPTPVLIGILVAVIALCAFFAYKGAVPDGGGRVARDTPDLVWLKKKSQDVQGDWSKFTPEEQARADQITNGRGAMSAAMYGKPKTAAGTH